MSTIYEILKRPLVTEKTNYLSSKLHQYSFEVAGYATKTQVKEAVEKVFSVNVLSVRVINTAAKRTRRAKSRRVQIRNQSYKKAIVTIPADQQIRLFEGVE